MVQARSTLNPQQEVTIVTASVSETESISMLQKLPNIETDGGLNLCAQTPVVAQDALNCPGVGMETKPAPCRKACHYSHNGPSSSNRMYLSERGDRRGMYV